MQGENKQMYKKILIGTHNPNKLKEIRSILSQFPVEIVSLDSFSLPDVEENGKDYYENAAIKAKFFSQKTGLPCIADDTGLEVDALGGEPGIYSARWSGIEGDGRYQANNKKLLEKLKDVPTEERQAQFVCVIVFAMNQEVIFSVKGICKGKIINKLQGTNGFGYDPLFEVSRYKKTFAQLSSDIKNKISHRAKALKNFKKEFALKMAYNKK